MWVDMDHYGWVRLLTSNHLPMLKAQKLYNTIKAPMFSLSALDVDVFNQGPCPKATIFTKKSLQSGVLKTPFG